MFAHREAHLRDKRTRRQREGKAKWETPAEPLSLTLFRTPPKMRALIMSDSNTSNPLPRQFSSKVVDGVERAPSRGMLYAVGFKQEDFAKPQIGIASTWSQVTPCNIHLDRLAKECGRGADAAGAKAIIFNTITISDGISMGTEGMKYSLVSREVIADSIETVVGCQGMDGVVAIGGCDKNRPASVIAMARLNRPAVFVYGGTILPGIYRGKDVDLVS